jgi:hypothetical protein
MLTIPPPLNGSAQPGIRHVILDQPLRCFGQMMTAIRLSDEHGATIHLTERCGGKRARKRPGMGSGCMPLDPVTGADRCGHDLGELRREGAVDITPATGCWTPDGSPCATCQRPALNGGAE